MISTEDIHHMKSAIALARQGIGRCAPNPSVGCVIVKEGTVVGRARTADSGRPHAEAQALIQAGSAAKGATLYVTLEPCCHHGQTPPCTDAIINAGIRRVVVACGDPDKRVSGQGIAALRQCGISVDTGVLEAEALAVNRGFMLTRTADRPLVSLKIASTLDALVASKNGRSQWVTGDFARQRGHLERSRHDAIMVGAGTVLADDPLLSIRIGEVHHDPVRIVIDTNLRLETRFRLFDDVTNGSVVIFTAADTGSDREKAFLERGVQVIRVDKNAEGRCNLQDVLRELSSLGMTRVLVEGGPTLVTSFLREGLFDRLLWFRSASLLGSGRAAIGDLEIEDLDLRLRLISREILPLGQDCLEIFEREA